MTSAVLFLPAVIENFEEVSDKPITQLFKSWPIGNANHMNALVTNQNGLISNNSLQTVNDSAQLHPAESSTVLEIIEEDIPSAINEKEPEIKQPFKTGDMKEENRFHIQVASLKDPDIAHDIISELKQDYPTAYLSIQNDFYKVRIPDIKTSEQGYDLLKNIKSKFNLTPILVKRFR